MSDKGKHWHLHIKLDIEVPKGVTKAKAEKLYGDKIIACIEEDLGLQLDSYVSGKTSCSPRRLSGHCLESAESEKRIKERTGIDLAALREADKNGRTQ